MADFSQTTEDEILIVVNDIFDKTHYLNIVVPEKDGQVFIIPQNKLSPGIYFVIASTNNSYYKQKLIIK